MPAHLKLVEVNEDTGLNGCYLFNTYRYFQLHNTGSAFYFELINTLTNSISGVCHFTRTGESAFISPYRGTFAGPQLQHNNFDELLAFLILLEEALKTKGAEQIVFTPAPFKYNTAFSAQLEKAALQLGYSLMKNEPAYVMEVEGEEFDEKINRNRQRLLKKCFAASFTFQQIFTSDEMQEVYNVIVTNRQYKGYEISMTSEQIAEMRKMFNDSLFFFKATYDNVIVASAICIRINADILYVFYWGDLSGYEQYSPVTFIANGIYKFAQQHHYKLLDVGSASLHGEPIRGLINFKESLGFAASSKPTYSKML